MIFVFISLGYKNVNYIIDHINSARMARMEAHKKFAPLKGPRLDPEPDPEPDPG